MSELSPAKQDSAATALLLNGNGNAHHVSMYAIGAARDPEAYRN